MASQFSNNKIPMKKGSRQIHRWMSIAFTATVLLNIVVLGTAKPGTTPPV